MTSAATSKKKLHVCVHQFSLLHSRLWATAPHGNNNNRLYTTLYDKCGDFNFHIVNFPFLSNNNIPSGTSYGVYISQLIRYTRCCTYHADFRYRHKLQVERLLSQGYKVNRLRNSFKNICGRYGIHMQLQSIRSQSET